MKIRNGFVSNSSSSSYIIAWKGKPDKEFLEECLLKYFKIPYDSPFYKKSKSWARILGYVEHKYESFKEANEDYSLDDGWGTKTAEELKEYDSIWIGKLYTEDEEEPLTEILIEIDNEKFYLYSDGMF